MVSSLVIRTPVLHAGGHRFESRIAHHYSRPNKQIAPIILEPVPKHAPGAPWGHQYVRGQILVEMWRNRAYIESSIILLLRIIPKTESITVQHTS